MGVNEYVAGQFSKPTGMGGMISTFIMNTMNKKQYQSVIDNINIKDKDKILDIGFGNGKLLNRISQIKKAEYHGLEYSKDMLEKAKVKFGNLNLIEGNITKSPYNENTFDAIYTVNTIYFWDDAIKGLEEVKKILKDNGRFLNVFYAKEWLEKIKYTKYGFNKYRVKELIDLTNKAGLRVIDVIEISEKKAYCIIAEKI